MLTFQRISLVLIPFLNPLQETTVSCGEFSETTCLNGEVKFDHPDAIMGSGRNLSADFLKCGDYSTDCLSEQATVTCKSSMPLQCHADPGISGLEMANLGGTDCPIDKFGCVPVGVCKLHYILLHRFEEPYNHVLAFLALVVVLLILLTPIYYVNFCTPYGKANRAKAQNQR